MNGHQIEVSRDAYQAWKKVAQQHHVTVRGLVETVGFFLADDSMWDGDPGARRRLELVIAMTGERDAKKRTRRRTATPPDGFRP